MRILNESLLKQNVEQRMYSDLSEQKISGASVIVRQNGEVVYQGCFGTTVPNGDEPVTEGTVFRLASMTKPVTAVAAMMLVEQGLLRLDDPVEKYFPEFSEPFLAERNEKGDLELRQRANSKITVLHLLTHTSGIGSGEIGALQAEKMTAEDRRTLENTVRYYAKQGLAFEPFSQQAYSGVAAFDVLTAIIQQVSGEDYNEFLKNHLFLPCDMPDTTFVPSAQQWKRMITMNDRGNGKSCIGRTWEGCVFEQFPCTHYLGGAGLVSTISDYSNFAEMLLNLGSRTGTRILSEESVRQIASPHVPKAIQHGSERWGLGVRVITGENVLPVGSYGWSGAYGTHFWVDPVHKITAVYMKNSLYDGGSGALTSRQFEQAVYSAL